MEVNPEYRILECLNKIKWELDGSLTFHKDCRNTICGSCGLKINGRSALACKENVKGELDRLGFYDSESIPEIIISPFKNLLGIKDLVVKMDQFWQDLEKVDPYVSSKSGSLTEGEFYRLLKREICFLKVVIVFDVERVILSVMVRRLMIIL